MTRQRGRTGPGTVQRTCETPNIDQMGLNLFILDSRRVLHPGPEGPNGAGCKTHSQIAIFQHHFEKRGARFTICDFLYMSDRRLTGMQSVSRRLHSCLMRSYNLNTRTVLLVWKSSESSGRVVLCFHLLSSVLSSYLKNASYLLANI